MYVHILAKINEKKSILVYLQSILDNMSGPLYKFYTNGRIFFKLDSNGHPNLARCRTHLTLVPALSRTLVGVWIAFSDSSSCFRLDRVKALSNKICKIKFGLRQASSPPMLHYPLGMLFTFENKDPLMRYGSSVVWQLSWLLMNSFNKTEAAVFLCRLCFMRDFPFISLMDFPYHTRNTSHERYMYLHAYYSWLLV